jgi:hypothetical protein
MEKRLVIFFMISTAVIVSVGLANHRLPEWIWWGIADSAGIRLLVQLFINKKKSDI